MTMMRQSLFLLLALLVSLVQAANVQRKSMVGAYFPADVKDPFVQEVAQFAVESLAGTEYAFLAKSGGGKLKPTVVQAQVQIVAGRNYKLAISVSNSKGCLGGFNVVIYDHFGTFSITQWGEEMTCAQAKLLLKSEQEKDENSDE